MNIAVRHNGTSISTYVIEYEREHKICTGIGQLNLVVAGNIPRTFEPWDTIDIYENGSFQVKYYVSSVTASQPSQTITLECQDKSKRLVDYFIPTQYTIDYPSYTGYWVKKFLTEAGISYQFTTSDTGVLLSNNTALGLTPAYEQVMQLLQLSGWYMFFDGNGIAKIGNLTSDFGNVKATYGKNTILSIAKISDDKMLRNRAVVWGAFDPIRREFAYADISTNTRWNYDRRDKRSMVVSNGNIPNKSSAYGIANKLLKEFSRITVEKHLTVAGASNRDLGDVVRVRSDVYSGTGMITTFGVHMSKDGLTTNMVLDERCPRLFGFFDFGDYVYVGTYGAGVWRKHIRFDHTWHNFSTGLQDLAITDLHINNEVFGSIAASGDMYYATSNDGPWVQYAIESLLSSAQNTVELTGSGLLPSGIEMIPFSGLMGRAVIVDRLTNALKYGIDTASGVNYGDYFLSYSGIVTSFSGVLNSGMMTSSGVQVSGYRGWIVELDPFTSISGVYPISVSGNFDIMVLDLENDGLNDYVSIKTGNRTIIEHTAYGYNFGSHVTSIPHQAQDSNSYVSMATLERFSLLGSSKGFTLGTTGAGTGASAVAVFDNESINEREIVWRGGGKLNRLSMAVEDGIVGTTTTSPLFSFTGQAVCITKVSTNVYRFFSISALDNGTTYTTKIYYTQWDALAGTVGTETLVSELIIANNQYHTGSTEHFDMVFKVVNRQLVAFTHHNLWAVGVGSSDPDQFEKNKNRVYVYKQQVDLASATETINSLVFEQIFNETYQVGIPSIFWTVRADSSIKIFQNGNDVAAVFTATENEINANDNYKWLCYTRDGTTWHSELIQTSLGGLTGFIVGNTPTTAIQLTGENYVYAIVDSTRNRTLIYNGNTYSIESISSLPWYLTEANIYGLFGAFDNYYIAKNGSNWYFCNPQTFSPEILFTPPTGYTMVKPFSSTDSISPRYYWQARNSFSQKVILQTTESSTLYEAKPTGSYTDSADRGFIAGNFLVDCAILENTSVNLAILYLDNRVDVPDKGTSYLVLQRAGTDFHIIQESSKPIRVDISNSSPLLTVLDNENSFQSHFIFDNEITTFYATSHDFSLTPPSGVRDYRYTMLEVPSGVTSSGLLETVSGWQGVGKLVLYAIASGINYTYTDNLSSGYMQVYTVASGLVERIETSNYVASGQYIFVTTSGDSPDFYQKDPMSDAFISYSGLPDFRATIIRLDDRI